MDGWTLAELAELAARALSAGQVRAASGRVTAVPDARVIRWYATIGLLDRPTIGAGRLARYGVRHLLQLVAVKRLQAQGLPLARIQQRLAGATDEQLRAVAALPEGLTDVGARPTPEAAARTGVQTRGPRSERPTAADRFWSARPTPSAPTAGERNDQTRPENHGSGVDSDGDTVSRVYGVRLGGLTLLLPTEPMPHDLDEIAAAARPLLDLLAARGWLGGTGGQVPPHGLLDPTEGAQR